MGYENDEICPSRYEQEEGEEVDYEILRKVIGSTLPAIETNTKKRKKKKIKRKSQKPKQKGDVNDCP